MPNPNEIQLPPCEGPGPHDNDGLFMKDFDGGLPCPYLYACKSCFEAAGCHPGLPAAFGGRDVNYENP